MFFQWAQSCLDPGILPQRGSTTCLVYTGNLGFYLVTVFCYWTSRARFLFGSLPFRLPRLPSRHYDASKIGRRHDNFIKREENEGGSPAAFFWSFTFLSGLDSVYCFVGFSIVSIVCVASTPAFVLV